MYVSSDLDALFWTRVFQVWIYLNCLLDPMGSDVVRLWALRMCLFWGWQLIALCSVIILATFAGYVSTTPVPDSLRAWSPALWGFVIPNIPACACLGCLLMSICYRLRAFRFIYLLWLKYKAWICLVKLVARVRSCSMNVPMFTRKVTGCHFTKVWVWLVLGNEILYIVCTANDWVGWM